MSRDDIEAVRKSYDDWNSSEIVGGRQLLFARQRRLDRPISDTEIKQ